jgi:hypothetical protein
LAGQPGVPAAAAGRDRRRGMSDIVMGYDAADALFKAGLVPERCSEVTIHIEVTGMVEIQTRTYMSHEEWIAHIDILADALCAGKVQSKHEYVNTETKQVLTVAEIIKPSEGGSA